MVNCLRHDKHSATAPRKNRVCRTTVNHWNWKTPKYLVANYTRIVSGLVHPSDLHGIRSGLIHINHWGELTHLRFVGSSPPSRVNTDGFSWITLAVMKRGVLENPPHDVKVFIGQSSNYCWWIWQKHAMFDDFFGSTENSRLNRKLWVPSITHDGSMYAVYGNMDPINIPQSC